MKISLTLLFLFLLNHIFAAELTTITGHAPGYSNSEILFYQYKDPISEEIEELFKLKIDENGNFKANVQLENVTHAFADFDSYSANIYLVPDKSYQIILPTYKKITNSQRHNPFFKPFRVQLAIKNSDETELNRKIREFEKAFIKTEGRFFEKIYRKKSSAAVDSVQTIMNRDFPKSSDSFFEDYKFYRLAFAEYVLHKGENENFTLKYFNNHKSNFTVAPYKTLFNRIYSDFFSQLTNSVNGAEFRKILGSSDLSQIENYLIKNQYLNSETAQLVILKSIHDAFHQGQFSQKSLLSLLSKIQAGSWSPARKAIAKRLEKKLTHLLPQTKTPSISFTNFNEKSYSLADYHGKLVYLHFTRITNPICKQHLNALKKLPEAVKNDISIVNLVLEEERPQLEHISMQNWEGQFFVVSDEIAELWKVKSFPSSFLIDETGKLIFSPANNPLDGFNKQAGVFLQKRHLEKLRNQAR